MDSNEFIMTEAYDDKSKLLDETQVFSEDSEQVTLDVVKVQEANHLEKMLEESLQEMDISDEEEQSKRFFSKIKQNLNFFFFQNKLEQKSNREGFSFSRKEFIDMVNTNLTYASAAIIMSLPFLVNYSIILTKHPSLAPYAPYFFKIVVLSSTIHSVIAFVFGQFRTESTLVHDTPILLLSNIFSILADQITDINQLISTCLVAASLASFLSGISKN